METNHPAYYQANGIETIDVITAFTAKLRGVAAFDTGNCIKYLCRWSEKGGLADLKKAQWYLNHLIETVQEDNP